MSGKCHKSKNRKLVETSLGQARKDIVDESHLRRPVITSIVGLKQLFTLFDTATSEVKDYISYECDILYECRFCRTIFRSLANFILHKRNYCRDKYETIPEDPAFDLGGFVVDPDEGKSDSDSNNKKSLMPIIDKLLKQQEIDNLAEDCLNEDLSAPKDEGTDDDVVFVPEETKEAGVVLEKIDTSKAAVFQTQRRGIGADSMKSEVLEIHEILHNNEVALGTSGRICNFETKKRLNTLPPKNLVCRECNFTFSTLKTLTHHIKYKHNKTCIVYPCPDCKQTFTNAWSVYRHLFKVHRRTTAQVKRMRAQIHSSRIRKDQEPPRKKAKSDTEIKEDTENQWMSNIEGDKDFQMCGGCGRRFERKAALQSHSQMCTKRIAICNSIKERKNKKSVEKPDKVEESKVLKGARRRKPSFMSVHRYQPEEVLPINLIETLPEIEIFTISDDSNEEVPPETEDDEFKEYVNDDADHVFLEKAAPYMAKDELKCLPCSDTFLSPNQLLWHMSMHFSWFRFQCSKCSFTSFNKYDCTTHALVNHGTPTNLMESTVLPIPKWKVLCGSHEFTELTEEVINNNSLKHDARELPVLETIPTETIVLEDDEMPDICDIEDAQEMDEEPPEQQKPGPSKNLIINERPVRNRMKSVKTLQSDFIYDLGKVLKLNDNSIKGSRLKKSLK